MPGGARIAKILAAVDLHGAKPVVVLDRRAGQSASLRAGLAALKRGADAVVVTLADRSQVTTSCAPTRSSGSEVVASVRDSEVRAREHHDQQRDRGADDLDGAQHRGVGTVRCRGSSPAMSVVTRALDV